MKRTAIVIAAIAMLQAPAALAKLPPPSDEAKAKAAEAAAKTAYSNKVAAYQLCKSMDRVAGLYLASARKNGKDVKPTETPPCSDPGPFVAADATDKKPLEAAGAHSPPATAATPPNTKQPAASIEKTAKPTGTKG
jgi:hypothetical protein